MPKTLLSIILINYYEKRDIKKCLELLNKNIRDKVIKNTEVIILNNSPEENLNVQKNEYKNIYSINIINSKKNLGFARAMNLGVKKSSGRYLLFLNNDIDFNADFITPLIKFYKINIKNIGLISPRLMLKNGKPQPYAYGYQPSFLGRLRNRIIENNQIKSLNQKTIKTEWIAGTAMLISQKKYRKIGGFDNNYFIYFEDADLCWRAQKQGWNNYVLNQSKIIHYGGAKTNTYKESYYESQDYFNRKFFGITYEYLFKLLRQIYFRLKKIEVR